MCAIIDINTAIELLGERVPEPARRFLDAIEGKRQKLVVGGTKYSEELDRNSEIKKFIKMCLSKGYARQVRNRDVDELSAAITQQNSCTSDDEHIIALAQISGARLLYSNDKRLGEDFKNRTLVQGTKGRIYSTRMTSKFTNSHKNLLRRRDLCPRNIPS